MAFVTGASRGIGRATAIEFARRGYDVAVVARSADDLAETARRVEQAGGAALSLVGDLADLDFAQRAVSDTAAQWDRLDVLVNNAAWRELASMRTISIESWERTLRVSLTTPAFLARWAAELMQRRGHGVIVNVSSMMSAQAAGFSPAYIAAKGGLDSLTYELASLYGPAGIRVVAINPGAIDTEMSRDVAARDVTAQDDFAEENVRRDDNRQDDTDHDGVRRFSEDMIMLGRWGTPDEIARLIATLTGDDCAYITGTTITADGGWSRQHLPQSLQRRTLDRE
ncbi:MAG: SDR family oxidoreductase [Planctomycetales bacterium]|nr:SDR family oxidoreductase [Planctomycetales bacterium]